jgi:hypothetical protein
MLDAIGQPAAEAINAIGHKVGLTAVVANIGIVASIEAGIIELVSTWGMPDTALVVSTAVSVMFFFKLKMDYNKAKLEIELMKKKAEQESKEKTAR